MFSPVLRLFSIRRFPAQAPELPTVKPPVAADVGRGRFYFAATIVLYAAFMALVEGRWVFSGQMWAEMASNYYPNAVHPDWLQRLFATDAGYIPLIPRLIALLGAALSVEPQIIPYYYTWTAVILTGAIVGAFSLAPFRALVRSDAARFLLGLVVLVVADFETRTFINFTYFGTFLLAALMALALRPEAERVSPWMWAALLLTLSKPYVFTVAPLALLALLVARPHFRVLAGLTLALICVQLGRLMLSASQGLEVSSADVTLPEKAWSAAIHAAAQTAGYLAGPQIAEPLSETPWVLAALGAALLVVMAAMVIVWRRHRVAVLLLTGMALIAGTAAINAFALSGTWAPDLSQLSGLPLYRHTITLCFGAVFLIAGFAGALGDRVERWGGPGGLVAVGLVALWAMASGWPGKGIYRSQIHAFPIVGAGMWQQAGPALARHDPGSCIPIDPFPWVYGPGCRVLAQPRFEGHWIAMGGADPALSFDPPPVAAGKTIRTILFYVRQDGAVTSSIDAVLTLRTRDGRDIALRRRADISNIGGSLMFEALGEGVADVVGLRLTTDVPVTVLAQQRADGQGLEPATLWIEQ